MNLIKLLLILSFATLFIWAFRNRANVGLRAGVRVFAVVLMVIAVISILVPDVLQSLADVVGVTRGTDLVLYALVVVFAGTTVGTYFRFRDLERRLAAIVRADAIRDAALTNGIPGFERTGVNPSGATGPMTQPRDARRVRDQLDFELHDAETPKASADTPGANADISSLTRGRYDAGIRRPGSTH